MKYIVTVENRKFGIQLDERSGGYEVKIKGKVFPVDIVKVNESNYYSIIIANRSYEAVLSSNDGTEYRCYLQNELYTVDVEDELSRSFKALGIGVKSDLNEEIIKAPMPGLIVGIEVKEGERISRGDGVVIMEAMKMENELRTTMGGTVSQILVTVGTKVEQNTTLVVIERES
jgi:biotin carboxyl carrier protein